MPPLPRLRGKRAVRLRCRTSGPRLLAMIRRRLCKQAAGERFEALELGVDARRRAVSSGACSMADVRERVNARLLEVQRAKINVETPP